MNIHIQHKSLLSAILLAALIGIAGCQVQLDNKSASDSESESETSASGSAGDSDSATSGNTQSVTLSWSRPYERVNGNQLQHFEIGGYEIRYRSADTDSYEKIVIDDPSAEFHYLDDLPAGDYTFKIAAFDTDGLYSSFVTATN